MPIPELFISPVVQTNLARFGPTHWNNVSGLLDSLFNGPDGDGLVLTRNAASPTGAIWSSAGGVDLSGYVLTSDARLSDARTPLAHTHSWASITGTPTTLAGYGITDGGGGAAAAGTLTGTTLAANVVASSLTSVGILASVAIGNADLVLKRSAVSKLGVYAADGVTLGSINVAMGTHAPSQFAGVHFGTLVDGQGGWIKWRQNGDILLVRNASDSAPADFTANVLSGTGLSMGDGAPMTMSVSGQFMKNDFWMAWNSGAFTSSDMSIGRRTIGSFKVGTGGFVGSSLTPTAEIYVRNVRLDPYAAVKPVASVDERGSIWHVYGANGVKDTVEICAKDASDAYAWRVIY